MEGAEVLNEAWYAVGGWIDCAGHNPAVDGCWKRERSFTSRLADGLSREASTSYTLGGKVET